jgi:hypothetical protein
VLEFINPLKGGGGTQFPITLNWGQKLPSWAGGGIAKALDFSAPIGTPVYADNDGVIASTEYNEGGGNLIKLDHPGDFQSVYGHLDRYATGITEGTAVRRGQLIAYSGNTGKYTNGPHLYYEVKKKGVSINPLSLFSITGASGDYFDPGGDPILYRDILEWLTSRKEGASGKTWAEFINTSPAGLFPRHTSDDLLKATDKLGITDKLVDTDLFPLVAATAISGGAGVLSNPLDAVGKAFGFILDPVNWARILALIAGSVLAFAGFQSMWSAAT